MLSVGDGVARIYGLDNVQAGELVEFNGGVKGMALNLRERQCRRRDLRRRPRDQRGRCRQAHRCHCRCPGRQGTTRTGRRSARQPDRWQRADRRRAHPRRGQGSRASFPANRFMSPCRPGSKRSIVWFRSGAASGELIIGDRQTGKTAVAIDTIINQKEINASGDESKKLYCIYVAVGQKRSTVAQVVKTLADAGALEYTIVVSATASGTGSAAVPGALFGLRDGRVLPRQRHARADHLRRSLEAGDRLSADVAAAASPAAGARRSPVMSSTCIPACSNAPPR